MILTGGISPWLRKPSMFNIINKLPKLQGAAGRQPWGHGLAGLNNYPKPLRSSSGRSTPGWRCQNHQGGDEWNFRKMGWMIDGLMGLWKFRGWWMISLGMIDGIIWFQTYWLMLSLGILLPFILLDYKNPRTGNSVLNQAVFHGMIEWFCGHWSDERFGGLLAQGPVLDVFGGFKPDRSFQITLQKTYFIMHAPSELSVVLFFYRQKII